MGMGMGTSRGASRGASPDRLTVSAEHGRMTTHMLTTGFGIDVKLGH